jgi:hypothetical protein
MEYYINIHAKYYGEGVVVWYKIGNMVTLKFYKKETICLQ